MAEEFRLVTDDASSSLWELVDKELAVKRQTKDKLLLFLPICQRDRLRLVMNVDPTQW